MSTSRHASGAASHQQRDRARGALLGTFVGDALGMPFEGKPPATIPARLDMLDARLGRGTYTDDTQMAIALAESLLAAGRVDEEQLGRAFVAAYDPERGYGSGTRAVLAMIQQGIAPADAAQRAFEARGRSSTGAAMRIAPVAIRYAHDPRALREGARRSARVTHAHPVSIDAAVVQAAAIAAALRGEDALAAARTAAATPELGDALARAARLLEQTAVPAAVAHELGNTSAASEAVPAAIYAAVAQARFEDAVSFAIRCGGDTDTIGAMAGAIAGAREGAAAIPARWCAPLEDGDKGRSHVEHLADKLVARRLADPA